jgi:hypothetical protein
MFFKKFNGSCDAFLVSLQKILVCKSNAPRFLGPKCVGRGTSFSYGF